MTNLTKHPRRLGIALALAAVLPIVVTQAAGQAETAPEPVRVTLTEYRIQMPSELPAGQTMFIVTNAGNVEHAFAIEGKGVEKQSDAIAPMQSDTVTVALEPGAYKVFDPVEDYEERGALVQLKVIAATR